MFLNAKTREDYRKAEEYADQNFDVNTDIGKR
jgi:hypothetical protein